MPTLQQQQPEDLGKLTSEFDVGKAYIIAEFGIRNLSGSSCG